MANARLETEGFWRDSSRFGAANTGRPSCGGCCAEGFHREEFEWRGISDRCALRDSKGARRDVQVARYRLCHARLRSLAIGSDTVFPPLCERFTLRCVV